MTNEQAQTIRAALLTLRVIEKENRHAAYAATDVDMHSTAARIECAAENAAHMIDRFLIAVKVYGSADAASLANAVLFGGDDD